MGHSIHQLKHILVSHWSLVGAQRWVLPALALMVFLVLLSRWLRPRKRGRGRRGWFKRQLTADGYVRRILPSGRSRLEHRLVAEQILGRRLEIWEVVHHINGRRKDNRPANLCVMDRHEHERYHEWYDSIYKMYGKPPRRGTQLRKLRKDFGGVILAEVFNERVG